MPATKLLDMSVDLALIGKPIKRPDHCYPSRTATINNKFCINAERNPSARNTGARSYDCNREPVMDVNRIRELLPHRYPFQLVDKVIEIGALITL